MTAVSMHPKGTNFARLALALAYEDGDDRRSALAVADHRWGVISEPSRILRSAIGGGSLSDPAWAAALAPYRLASAEFVEALRPSTILGKLTGYRRAPMRTLIPRVTAGTTVAWVGEGPARLSAMALDMITVDALKICGIVVSTRELAELSTPSAENLIRADLLAAVAALTDRSFVDPANAGAAGVAPAAITYNAATITASGTTASACKSDLKRLFRLLTDEGINLVSPYLITDRRTAVALTFIDDGSDFFGDVNVNGGMLAGVPLITSASVPVAVTADSPPSSQSSIVLIDAAELIVADENEATIDVARHANLQMDSAPDSPATTSTIEVSLWQRNLVAWKVTRPINWELRRAGAVAVLTSVNY